MHISVENKLMYSLCFVRNTNQSITGTICFQVINLMMTNIFAMINVDWLIGGHVFDFRFSKLCPGVGWIGDSYRLVQRVRSERLRQFARYSFKLVDSLSLSFSLLLKFSDFVNSVDFLICISLRFTFNFIHLGIHIHTFGDLSSSTCASLGPHWNPYARNHSCPGNKNHPRCFTTVAIYW